MHTCVLGARCGPLFGLRDALQILRFWTMFKSRGIVQRSLDFQILLTSQKVSDIILPSPPPAPPPTLAAAEV